MERHSELPGSGKSFHKWLRQQGFTFTKNGAKQSVFPQVALKGTTLSESSNVVPLAGATKPLA